MNSKELSGRLRSDGSRAARLAASERTPGEIVEELYLSIFSRKPRPDERDYAEKLILSAGDSRRSAIEDLMWGHDERSRIHHSKLGIGSDDDMAKL